MELLDSGLTMYFIFDQEISWRLISVINKKFYIIILIRSEVFLDYLFQFSSFRFVFIWLCKKKFNLSISWITGCWRCKFLFRNCWEKVHRKIIVGKKLRRTLDFSIKNRRIWTDVISTMEKCFYYTCFIPVKTNAVEVNTVSLFSGINLVIILFSFFEIQ